ncbi:E3 ubiquitin-protein ligase RAD18 isoform X2 [Engystomops pustulosus]|uniref:E3 ubiquitin-protein ligase RAD18 isoform X2 n=1 Tax=Engystomops pustulosus TaxID=76066 RepID=UPI003AFB1FD7
MLFRRHCDLDDLLHCGICFDYFNIAMIIPQCSHNYCSLCIRKFLSYKTQCPTCFVAVTESELRNNRLLDDVVRTFVSARSRLSQSLSDDSPQSPSSKLPTRSTQGSSGNKSMDRFLVKSSTKRSKRSGDVANTSMEAAPEDHTSAPSSSMKSIKLEPGVLDQSLESVPNTPSTSLEKVKVECPVCGVGILEQYINKHLDSCLTRDEKKESLRSSIQKRKPMAKVVYNLLSERDLKKRLREAGLSTHGSKQQMIRRHQEFLHMYNAQCDSLNPKSAAEIAKEIEKTEKIRSNLEVKQESGMTFTKDQSEAQIDEIHQDYRRKHKNEFQQLIDQMKGRWKTPKGKKVKEEPLECDADIDHVDHTNREVKEHSNLNHHTSPEAEESLLLQRPNASVTRSSSPVFPLSSESRASSSSDILRDLEEAAAVPEASDPALDQSGQKRKRRKTFPSAEASCKAQTSTSRRQRK